MEKIKDKRIVVLGLAIICLGLIIAIIITMVTGTHGEKQEVHITDEKIVEESDLLGEKDVSATGPVMNETITSETSTTTLNTTKSPTTTAKSEEIEKAIIPGSLATLAERRQMIKAIEVLFYMCIHVERISDVSVYDYETKTTIDGKEYCLIKDLSSISAYRKELSKYLADSVIDKYWFSKDYLKEHNGKLYILIDCLTGVGQHVGIAVDLPDESTSVSATYDGIYSVLGKWNMYGYVYYSERYEVEFNYVNGTLKMVNVNDYGPIADLKNALRPD